MLKVYITGIAGLIGSNLAKELIRRGVAVKGCDNLMGGYEDNIPSKYCKWDNIDILNQQALSASMKEFNPDVVIHTAALAHEGLSVFSPSVISQNIYSGTTSVATAAITAGVELFIQCSSMSRYGQGNPPFTEDAPTNPQDPYALAKVQAEEMLALLSKIHGLKYYVVVPHNVVGKGQVYTDPYRNVAAIFTNRVLLRKSIIIYGDGSQKRSFSPINSCVDAIIRLIESDRFPSGEIFNIGPEGNEITIKQLAYLVGHHCQVYPNIEYYPSRPQEVIDAWCSSEKAIKELNYNAISSNDETIKEIVSWVRTRGPREFNYHLPIEIVKNNTPKTWTEKKL